MRAKRLTALLGIFILTILFSAAFSIPLCAQTATETTLYSFTGGADGAMPGAGLVQGADGNLYSTNVGAFNGLDFGTVFKITPSGSLTTLYGFTATGANGFPLSPVVQGSDGNFYGTSYGNLFTGGDGNVFKVTPKGGYTSLFQFVGDDNGQNPETGLIQGADGNFYGMAGGGIYGQGTIFDITPSGNLTTLFSFAGYNGGITTAQSLVQGSDGNFYGVTDQGGTSGFGTVFQFVPPSTVNILYSFSGTGDGAAPDGALVEGSDGNFYGVTQAYPIVSGNQANGTIFRVTPSGTHTTLYTFTGGSDGYGPYWLVWGTDGNLYGVTFKKGTNNDGTFFQITPSGTLTTLYAFGSVSGDGVNPQAPVVQGSDGNFYGTAVAGGAKSDGTVFRISMSPALPAPVQLSLTSSTIALGSSATIDWQVLNAFSTTLQQCYAFVQNGATGAGSWTGLQSGTYSSSTHLYTGSATITPTAAGTYTYALTCGGMETGTATLIVQGTQTITVTTPAPKTAYDKSSFTVVATGGGSGNPIVFTSAGACTNVGATYTINATAKLKTTCTVTMNQAGNSAYTAAPQVVETTTVAAAKKPTVSLTGEPKKAADGSTFTVTATSNETGTVSTPTITTTSSACTVETVTQTTTDTYQATVAMTAPSGTCDVTATWAENYVYDEASKTVTTTAEPITPTVTFTGAPSTAASGATFMVVASSTNDPSIPTITASGACTVGGATETGTGTYQATVTMKKVTTGTCTTKAAWAATTDYAAASVTQKTTAEQ
jgi:uncharacterized repeat protein (TIGR03803 family)